MSEPRLPARVAFTAANYWPEESGNAPYTTGLAEDLAAHGVDVTVLCAMPHYPQWRIRDGYRGRWRVREQRNGVRIIRSWLWVPSRQSAVQRALFEGSFFSSSLLVRGIARPDVVVGVTPSLSGALLARVMAKRFRVPYGLIVQDLAGPGARQSGISGGRGVAGIVRSMEGWALSGARSVSSVSMGFESYLRELGIPEDRIVYARNWSHVPRSDADPAVVRARLGLPEGVIALHAGAMGLKQGLEQVVDAAKLADERGDGFCFVLAGDGSQRESLERRARGLGNVAFLPQQPDDSYMDLLAAADVLILSERPSMVDMSLPGKLTSYLMAGRPIVASVPSDGATAAEVERSGAGIVTPSGDPAAMLAALERLSKDRGRGESLARAGAAFAESVLDEDVSLGTLRAFVAGLMPGSGPAWAGEAR